MNDGKLTDVLIEEQTRLDPSTGMEKFSHLQIWADPNMGEIIRNIPGVSSCFQDHFKGTRYDVFLDPRYDREWVKAEIEAQIKIQG